MTQVEPRLELAGLQATALTGTVGAVVEGIDLAGELSEDDAAAIRGLLVRYGVLFFRAQHLTPDTQIAFPSRLGPLTKGHPNTSPSPGFDERILNLQAVKANHWHSDVSFVDRPPQASVLSAVTVPEVGGDTAFASAVAAYRSLPEPLQRLADSLDVVHSNTFDYGTLARTAEDRARLDEAFKNHKFETLHPLVQVIPETGERALFLGGFASRVDGLDGTQSRAVLDLFQSHITRIEHTVRWHWSAGDVAIWDNRVVQHTLVDDLPTYEGRHHHRVTVAGRRAVGIDGRESVTLVGDSTDYAPSV